MRALRLPRRASIGNLLKPYGPLGTRRGRSMCPAKVAASSDGPDTHYGVAPLVEGDAVREEEGADTVPVTANWVDYHLECGQLHSLAPDGIGNTGWLPAAGQRHRRWASISSAKTWKAVSSRATAPSG